MPSEKAATKIRVVQWATGKVGSVALRHFLQNSAYELAGVFVTDSEKAGRDAGELVGATTTGIIATSNPDDIVALQADCVHFTPAVQDIAMVCRLLRSGKNVVSALGPFDRSSRLAADLEAIEAACLEGGTSFHGSGIHPGFSGDLLPLTLMRLMDRVDHIHIYEVVNHLANPSAYIEFMGFGRECDDLLANPSRSQDAPYSFAESMGMVAEAMGETISKLTTKLEVAAASGDIAYPAGVIRKGTVAGQHYEWTGWIGSRPFITYHFFWKMGEEMEPNWPCGEPGYRVVIEGNPPMDVSMRRPEHTEHGARYISLWTAMAGVNAIARVCKAPPGIVTHLDLGTFAARGLLRSPEVGTDSSR